MAAKNNTEDQEREKASADTMREVFKTLYAKREEMEQFMDLYLFKRAGCSKDGFIDDKRQFFAFIKVCARLRSGPLRPTLMDEIRLGFTPQYPSIKKLIQDRNIKELQTVFYGVKGIGQKIGSLMLELIFLYSRYRDEQAAAELYVPIDTHINRIFEESFGLNPPRIGVSPSEKRFIAFQDALNEYTGGKPRVYFDYLWYIGKVYCEKTNPPGQFSPGYKLCKDCWIEKQCAFPMKWEWPAPKNRRA
jgi:hypothetical protein